MTATKARDEALAIRCRVVRAPGLEGLCDGRSLRALLATVKPRALVAQLLLERITSPLQDVDGRAEVVAVRDGPGELAP